MKIQRDYNSCLESGGDCSNQPLMVVMLITLVFTLFFCVEMAVKVSMGELVGSARADHLFVPGLRPELEGVLGQPLEQV